jgi:hypothetical protein
MLDGWRVPIGAREAARTRRELHGAGSFEKGGHTKLGRRQLQHKGNTNGAPSP